MYDIRKLTFSEYSRFVDLASNAYPGMNVNSAEEKEALIKRLEKQTETSDKQLYGCFKGSVLVGGMLLHDFIMTYQYQTMKVGGLGFVCVDLLHKKEKVAKNLVTYFEDYFLKRGCHLTALYPFRPDFYKKMGYGYGTKMNKFVFEPKQLPLGASKKNIMQLTENHTSDLFDCYNRYMEKTHGMMGRSEEVIKAVFQNPKTKVFGVRGRNNLTGYVMFHFETAKQGNFLSNNIVIKEMVTETKDALSELCTFLHTQQDQVNKIIWNTQEDNVHYLLYDPRNGTENIMPHAYHESNTSGVGLMYKILDTNQFFESLNGVCFGKENISIAWKLKDTLHGRCQDINVRFHEGTAEIMEDADTEAEVEISLSDFTSLMMGSVDFQSLYRLGLVRVSDETKIPSIHSIFSIFTKPQCLTAF
jgi:predicted acetyltransferase